MVALALVAGAFAIVGAPPFAIFVSELVIFKAGIASGQYLTIGLLAFFVVVAFCAVMSHATRMAFSTPRETVTISAVPLSCRVTLALAAVPLFAIGIDVPSVLQELLRAAATAMGG